MDLLVASYCDFLVLKYLDQQYYKLEEFDKDVICLEFRRIIAKFEYITREDFLYESLSRIIDKLDSIFISYNSKLPRIYK